MLLIGITPTRYKNLIQCEDSRRLIISLEAQDKDSVIAQTSTLEGAELPQCPLYPRKRTFCIAVAMSALGQKQTCAVQNGMSVLPPKADIRRHDGNVR